MLNETLSKIHFWRMIVAYNVAFLAMFWVGVQGTTRRVADYPDVIAGGYLLVTIAAYGLGMSFVVFVYNFAVCWVRGPVAEGNPWRARTLEWQTSSPPPLENLEHPQVVTDDLYGYGAPCSIHASFVLPEAAGDD